MGGVVFRSGKFGFLLVILLLVFGGMVLASFDVDPTSLDFGGDGADPEEVKSETVSLSNNYVNYSLDDFILEFIPDDSLDDNPVSDGDFEYNSVGEIENMSSEDLDIDFTIPAGLSAIDGDFDGKRFDVGEINVTATATNLTAVDPGEESFFVEIGIPISLQVANHLEFYKNKVEIEIGSEDPKNISAGTTQEAYEGDNVKLKVFFENSFTDDKFKFDDGDVNVTLYVDGDEIEIEESNALIEGGEFDFVEFDFDLDGYDVDEKYDAVEANGGLHGETFEFEFEIIEDTTSGTIDFIDSDNDGVVDSMDLCPDTLTGCDVDEAGCELDTDDDGMCNGWDKYPNGEDEVKKEINDVKLESDKKEDEKVEEKENNGVEEEKKVEDKSEGFGNVMSFVFGLIVGVIGAVCFFVLTKV